MEEKDQTGYIYHNGMAYASDEDEKAQQKEEKNREKSKGYWFTGIQAAVCLLVLLAVLLLKAVGGPWFESVRRWYQENMEQSLLIEYDPDQVKREILEIFGEDEKTE